MQSTEVEIHALEIGVVGIGLMGSSIITFLLACGHHVQAIAPISEDFENAGERIAALLKNCEEKDMLSEQAGSCFSRLHISTGYHTLKNCALVLECVIEDIGIKREVYKKITDVVPAGTVLASNTSAIPITRLQKEVDCPERFLGIHWAEPAFATRFLEITNGAYTDQKYTQWVFRLACAWGKEPTVLKKDIKGFITNRLMYAVYREIFHLIETGSVTKEDADKAFRYDVGSWITLMGIFRRMDYTGVQDYAVIFENTFPRLSNAEKVPEVMKEIVENNGQGIRNQKGLYEYTQEEAAAWEKAMADFSTDIFKLATQYPALELQEKTF